jgi:drug/metabolite transporter (DMT)-like permease
LPPPPSPAAFALRPLSLADWGLLVLLSLLWGGSFFFIAIAVTELPPLVIVASRVLIAALALHLVLRIGGERLPTTGAAIGAFALMGVFNNAIPFTLLVWGQSHIASGLAAILNATTPLFTVLVAHFATTDERLTLGRIAGVLVGFSGVVAMIGPGALAGVEADVLAELACLGAALCYGFATVFGRRFRRLGLSPVQTATGQLTASTLIMVPVALVFAAPWTLPVPSTSAIGSVVALALASTAFAYIVFFRILARSGATSISLVTFMVPVSAMLLGTLVLGERLAPEHFLGIALIGVGLALIDGRPLKRIAAAVGRRA